MFFRHGSSSNEIERKARILSTDDRELQPEDQNLNILALATKWIVVRKGMKEIPTWFGAAVANMTESRVIAGMPAK
jgi:hypothetical protein